MAKANHHRKGFGLKDQVEAELKSEYEASLIAQLRANGYTLTRGRVTVKLAQAFGFCWGVDRAVSMAYETREHFPDRRIWITNEIIHNPVVNENLRRKNIRFVPLDGSGKKDFSQIASNDVVILPAFGASVQELEVLQDRNCEIVDTTCPWVSRVWNRVAKYEQADFTAIIHGKYNHEETIATSSRSKNYLIVQNLAEAEWVCDFILNGGDGQEFLSRFSKACSKGFKPTEHLNRVGIANQTTMLKGETEQIGKLFERTMLTKFGPSEIDFHFLSPGDTICDATQERQEAMFKLVDEPVDVMLVIGGFNSSNTGHLQEIAEARHLRSFHIDGPDCVGPGNTIRYKSQADGKLLTTNDWLPEGEVIVGVTSGASTPDQVVAHVLEKTFAIAEAKAV
ncbi:MAG: 4-hydroxy-3-methylbut-2-enyl diphosphate reductase [Candidatus Melainabacteria bacterium]|nr:MAG: 4-hydroxy-3-methylbut-2-enyl diphosphate reductase [Candidatus Melainabacteria bacterium]